jgi:hypothetical protein
LSFCQDVPTWTQEGCPVAPVSYEIGDVGPAGGWVFHTTDDGLQGLEADPDAQDDGTGAQWGCDGEVVPGTFSGAVGAGQANTNLILGHSCGIDPIYGPGTHDVAILTENYELNGYADWFLPGHGSLVLMRDNLHSNNKGNFKDGRAYWSSVQRDYYDYEGQGRQVLNVRMDGAGCCSGILNKYNNGFVRAVRAF